MSGTSAISSAAVLACALTTLAAARTETRSLHQDEVFTFATVMAVGRVAPARCPGITADTSGVWALSRTLHVEPTDDTVVDARTDDVARIFTEQVDKAGAKAWCDDVYANFGPAGMLMRGLLHR